MPCLYEGTLAGKTLPDERFFMSFEEPRVVEEYSSFSGVYRSITWGPYYFISRLLILEGPYGYEVPNGTKHVWGLQWYRGEAKVDAARTAELQSGVLCGIPIQGYVYITTEKELSAFRFREVDYDYRRWENQAGQ